MGCFSYICPECDKNILSDGCRGEFVFLFLIKDGRILEHIRGEYDSYGRVFNDDQTESIGWEMDWDTIVDMQFSTNPNNGILAIHSRCFTCLPTPLHKSKDDPDQGWGENMEKLIKERTGC